MSGICDDARNRDYKHSDRVKNVNLPKLCPITMRVEAPPGGNGSRSITWSGCMSLPSSVMFAAAAQNGQEEIFYVGKFPSSGMDWNRTKGESTGMQGKGPTNWVLELRSMNGVPCFFVLGSRSGCTMRLPPCQTIVACGKKVESGEQHCYAIGRNDAKFLRTYVRTMYVREVDLASHK